jgi:putative ABC transport system permease protein
MKRGAFPGRVTEAILALLLGRSHEDELIGDLIEEARTRILPARGRAAAQLWLLVEGLRSIAALESVMDLFRLRPVSGWLGDFRFALRTLGKRPLFALLTVLTLSVGIGAATAMFSVVDGVLLKRLPFHDPHRLVTLWKVNFDWVGEPDIGSRWDRGLISWQDYSTWSGLNTHFDGVAAYQGTWRTFTGGDRARLLSVGEATASLVPTLGVTMRLGRWFSPDEEAPAGVSDPSVAVLSYALWQRAFGGDEGVLGTDILLQGEPYTIVGVLPADFRLRQLEDFDPGTQEAWVPVGENYAAGRGATTSHDWEVIGRLAPDATIESASAEVVSLLMGDQDPERKGYRLEPRINGETRGLTTPLLLLLASTGVLLLIGCGNASMLLLGEMEGREHELATRAALGAGWGRIVRQLVTEGVVLGLLGSAAGALLAALGTKVLIGLAPTLPRMDEVTMDSRALAACALLGVGTGALFAMGPAVLTSRRSPAAVLSRSSRVARGRRRLLTQVVVVGQVAMTVVLLVSGGLLGRHLTRLTSRDPGFDPDGIATAQVTIPLYRYGSAEEVLQLFGETVRAIENIPGVANVAAVFPLPFSGDANPRTMIIDPNSPDGGRRVEVMRSVASPEYSSTLRLPLIEGRWLTHQDDRSAPPVTVVSRSLARRYWPGESPLGKAIATPGGGRVYTVVGVVGDVLRESFAIAAEPTYYVPLAQSLRLRFNLVARTEGDAGALVGAMTDAINSVGPEVPVMRGATLASLIDSSTGGERFSILLMRIFGAIGAVLAVTGIFGVTSRQIAQNRREMGIRLSLGATAPALVKSVTLRNAQSAGLGTVLGAALSLWATSLLTGLLSDLRPFQPLVLGTVGVSVLGVCIVAALIPARRIAKLDPATVLHAE